MEFQSQLHPLGKSGKGLEIKLIIDVTKPSLKFPECGGWGWSVGVLKNFQVQRVTYPNSTGTEAPALGTLSTPHSMHLFIWI